ncbi:MAG TPA: SDR family oxidoreductase [Steroidobacteraceae bacterium]|nr:SDR family oxidoreductase [Steroidobacteraceae bacterium]
MAFRAFDLTGKVALITGGASGIGYGLAEGIAQAGGTVVIWGRRSDNNLRAAELLRQHGAPVGTRAVDVSVEADVVEGIQAAVKEYGRLDAVFANAGIGRGAPFVDLRTDDFRTVMGTNLEGAFWTLREGARHMVQRAHAGDPGGSLVAVSSLATHNGAPRNQAYAASKGALISMIKGCAVEFAPYGIRANALLPGWIATEMTAPVIDDPIFKTRVIPRVPMKRWGKPEDFGAIAVYLTSDASAFHTGDSIIIDGGWALS